MKPPKRVGPPPRAQRRQAKRRIDELSRRLDAWGSKHDQAGDGPPPGEWDCLLGPIVELLTRGRPAEEIAARVSTGLHNHYGLAGARDDVVFATELLRWWNETKDVQL